jgi:hypothetical protein
MDGVTFSYREGGFNVSLVEGPLNAMFTTLTLFFTHLVVFFYGRRICYHVLFGGHKTIEVQC